MNRAEGAPGPAGRLEALWYGRSALALLLLPLAALFGLGAALRRLAFRQRWADSHRLPVPVLVVGNLTVGGTGKTPVTAWLAAVCQQAGHRPGIVSRGYGGHPAPAPRLVTATDDAADVGDEPLMLRRETGLPVCVHPDRVAAARRLVAEGVTVVIADDGLQHYRLQRDVEFAVVDATRGLGNGWLLPAGPLREPRSRLASVDFVLLTGATGERSGTGYPVGYRLAGLRALDGSARCALAVLAGRPVRALAGIGNPGRFHAQLAAAGLQVTPIPVPDHGRVDLAALARASDEPIIMTAKDAVKYRPVNGGCPVWVAELALDVPASLTAAVRDRLAALTTQERA